MKRLLLLAVLCVSPCVFAQQGYTTTWTGLQLTDLTSHCQIAGQNCWIPLPSGLAAYSVDIGGDGSLAALTTAYNLYTWNASTLQWTIHNEAGLGWARVVVQDATHIYLESGQVPQCGDGQNRAIYFWSGSGAPVQKNGCFQIITVGKEDGSLSAIKVDGTVWQSTDGANTWTQITGAPVATDVSASDVNNVCIISNSTLYTRTKSNDGFVAFSPAPPNGAQGCLYRPNAPDYPFIVVYNTHGDYMFDFNSQTWTLLQGFSNYKLAAYGKGTLFGISASNVIQHYNVYAGYYAGTISGQFQTCPGLNNCPGGAIHTVKLQVTFPHGIYGNLASQAGPFTSFLSATGYDASTQCDVLFNPGSPECNPTVIIDEADCSVVGFLGGGSPLPPNSHFSEDIESYSGTNRTLQISGSGNHWIATISCDATDQRCGGGTSAVCGPPTIIPQPVEVDGYCFGGSCTAVDAVDTARMDCALHSYLEHGAWGMFYVYLPGLAKQTCQRQIFYRVTPYSTPCF
jgi:hypothetical protein